MKGIGIDNILDNLLREIQQSGQLSNLIQRKKELEEIVEKILDGRFAQEGHGDVGGENLYSIFGKDFDISVYNETIRAHHDSSLHVLRGPFSGIKDVALQEIVKVDNKIRFLEDKIHYLDDSINLRKRNLVIRKERGVYSLRIDNERVVLYDGKVMKRLGATRKDKPLEIEEVLINSRSEKRIRMAKEFFNIDLKDFFLTEFRLLILPEEAQEKSLKIYEQVINGESILPAPENPTGYKVYGNGRKKTALSEIKYRNWSQAFLGELNPDKIIKGKILGSGGSYSAFVFGDFIIVEFDQESRATYLLDKDYFDQLKEFERSKILSENPVGFNGRLIHHKNGEKVWKKEILSYVK